MTTNEIELKLKRIRLDPEELSEERSLDGAMRILRSIVPYSTDV